MFEVQADKSRKLLRVAYFKRVEPDEAKACTDIVKERLGDLPAGFRLITDLTGLESMDLGCAPHLKRSMQMCSKAGVSKIVRIIPDPQKDIGLTIMSRFHYPRNIPIVTCTTTAEAEKALAE